MPARSCAGEYIVRLFLTLSSLFFIGTFPSALWAMCGACVDHVFRRHGPHAAPINMRVIGICGPCGLCFYFIHKIYNIYTIVLREFLWPRNFGERPAIKNAWPHGPHGPQNCRMRPWPDHVSPTRCFLSAACSRHNAPLFGPLAPVI